MQQVFLNLIGNAIKHGDEAQGTQVSVSVVDDPEDLYIEFQVKDTGPGISADYVDKIWGIFQTLQPRDKVEGTGIGLALVKKIVERQGGRIWVETAPGEGTTFHFRWPRHPPRRRGVLGYS